MANRYGARRLSHVLRPVEPRRSSAPGLRSVLFVTALARVHVCTNLLDDGFWCDAQVSQHFDEQAVRLREDCEDVCGRDGLASARTGALHRPLENVRGFGSDAESLTYVLARAFQTRIDGLRHHFWI